MSKRNATPGNEERLIRGPEDVPTGLSDEEQLEFWETHEISEEYLARTEEVPPEERPRPRQRDRHEILRLDRETVDEISALAEESGVAFQTLARDLLREAVREVRAGRKAVWQESGAATPDAYSGDEVMGPFTFVPRGMSGRSVFGLSPVPGPMGSLGRRFQPDIAPIYAPVEDAFKITQLVVQRAMLDSHASAFGTNRDLRKRVEELFASSADLQIRLAREAIKGLSTAAGARARGRRSQDGDRTMPG